jgi:hypothetical protein
MALPIRALHSDPRHYRDFGYLQEALGDIFVHADSRAEHAGPNEGQAREVEQALNRAVLAVGPVHDREDHINALAAAAAVERNQGGIGGVGGHHHALPSLQDFREHFLSRAANEPVAFFGDADGHGFVLVRVQAANHRGSGGQRNFMFAGAAAKENANAKSFLAVRSHGIGRFE